MTLFIYFFFGGGGDGGADRKWEKIWRLYQAIKFPARIKHKVIMWHPYPLNQQNTRADRKLTHSAHTHHQFQFHTTQQFLWKLVQIIPELETFAVGKQRNGISRNHRNSRNFKYAYRYTHTYTHAHSMFLVQFQYNSRKVKMRSIMQTL